VYVIATASSLGWHAAAESKSGRFRVLAASIAAGCFAGLALYHLFTDVLVVDLP
jgi:hypothetical protein